MKKVLHLTLFLALVAAIAGGALALANSLTAPIVAANALAAEKQNLQLIFPDAADSDFEEISVKDSGKILDYVVISNGDTQGIGTKVAEDSFKEKLVGKNAETDTLDTISGATVSSKPVVEGIQEAGKYLSENLK